MNISKLTKSDLNEAKIFMLKIIKEDFGYDYNPEWHKDISFMENIYLLNKRSCFFIAKDEGKIIGTIAARPYDKKYPKFIDLYKADDTLSVWRHYIKKEMRGMGIGSKLFNETENFAKKLGYKKFYLHTQKTIPGSMEYWMSKGFSIIHEEDDQFRTVHMEKKLYQNFIKG